MAKRGRPKLPAGERKKVTIHFRVTEAERRFIREQAKSSGITVGEYLRGWVMLAVVEHTERLMEIKKRRRKP